MIRGRDHKERVRDIVSSLMLFCREEEEKRTQTVMILFYVLPKKGFMEGTFFFFVRGLLPTFAANCLHFKRPH